MPGADHTSGRPEQAGRQVLPDDVTDLLATSAALYHRAVTRLQMEVKREEERLMQDARVAVDAFLTDCPEADLPMVIWAANDKVRLECERLRRLLNRSIEQEQTKRSARDRRIAQFSASRSPRDGRTDALPEAL